MKQSTESMADVDHNTTAFMMFCAVVEQATAPTAKMSCSSKEILDDQVLPSTAPTIPRL